MSRNCPEDLNTLISCSVSPLQNIPKRIISILSSFVSLSNTRSPLYSLEKVSPPLTFFAFSTTSLSDMRVRLSIPRSAILTATAAGTLLATNSLGLMYSCEGVGIISASSSCFSFPPASDFVCESSS